MPKVTYKATNVRFSIQDPTTGKMITLDPLQVVDGMIKFPDVEEDTVPKPRKCWSCGQPMEYRQHLHSWWCHSPKCQCYRYTDEDAAADAAKAKKEER